MSNEHRGRSPLGLILLTIAITTLVARKDLRDRLLDNLRELGGNAAELATQTYQDTVVPGLQEAGSRVQDVAQQAIQTGGERFQELREQGGKALATGLDTAQHAAQQAIQQAQSAAGVQLGQGKKQTKKAVKRARRELESRRQDLEKNVRRGAGKLGKEVNRRAAKLERALNIKDERPTTDPLSATLLTVGIVGAGGYILARSPKVRQSLLDGIRSVSPEAADSLHSLGRQIRGVVGSVWLERDEPAASGAPAAPHGGQGSSAGAAVEPGSAAAKRADSEKPQSQAQDSDSKTSGSAKH